MNCEFLRKQIKDDTKEITTKMEKHLESCADCQLWLQHSISDAPDGLTPPTWETPPVAVAEKVIPKPRSFTFSDFLSGIKYGMALGFAVVIALAFLENRPAPLPAQKGTTCYEFSFLPKKQSLEDLHFTVSENIVTTEPEIDSQECSFLDDGPNFQKITFLKEETNEEESWLPKSTG